MTHDNRALSLFLSLHPPCNKWTRKKYKTEEGGEQRRKAFPTSQPTKPLPHICVYCMYTGRREGEKLTLFIKKLGRRGEGRGSEEGETALAERWGNRRVVR